MHHREVPTVQRRELALPETLDDREDRGIDEAHTHIAIRRAEVEHTRSVLERELLDAHDPELHLSEHVVERLVQALLRTPIVDFDEDRRRDDENALGADKSRARAMMGIASIERGE
jgi:hypothetical protein